MIAGIASLVFIPLLSIGLAHLIWAFGGSYPARSKELLAQTVIGMPGRTRVPRLPAAFVAVLILVAGIVALSLADPKAGTGVIAFGLALGLLFLLRGAVGYTKGWQTRTPVEPFRTLDRKFYSPLCLALGAGFLFLVFWRYV